MLSPEQDDLRPGNRLWTQRTVARNRQGERDNSCIDVDVTVSYTAQQIPDSLQIQPNSQARTLPGSDAQSPVAPPALTT